MREHAGNKHAQSSDDGVTADERVMLDAFDFINGARLDFGPFNESAGHVESVQEDQTMGFDNARNVCVNGIVRVRSDDMETWSE